MLNNTRHTPCSLCYRIKSINDSIYPPVLRSYVAESEEDDVAQIFLDWLENDVKDIFSNYFQKKMIYGEEEEIKSIASDDCHICGGGGFYRLYEDKG